MIVTLLTKSAKAFVVAISGVVTAGAALSSVVAGLPGAPFAAHFVQESELAAMIEQLDAPDAHERAMAACRIGQMRRTDVSDVSAARDALLGLLGDDTPVESRLCREYGDWFGGRQRDSSPGREAAIALERVGEEALDPLLELLRDGPPVAREHAALALGLLENGAALDGLVAALDDDDVDAVRGRAAWALGMIEDPAAVEGLMAALEDEDAGVRKQALWALMQCVDDDAELDYEMLAEKLRKALIGG